MRVLTLTGVGTIFSPGRQSLDSWPTNGGAAGCMIWAGLEATGYWMSIGR